jgi:hypothetical protein
MIFETTRMKGRLAWLAIVASTAPAVALPDQPAVADYILRVGHSGERALLV